MERCELHCLRLVASVVIGIEATTSLAALADFGHGPMLGAATDLTKTALIAYAIWMGNAALAIAAGLPRLSCRSMALGLIAFGTLMGPPAGLALVALTLALVFGLRPLWSRKISDAGAGAPA